MFFIFMPLMFLPGLLIYSLGMYFWVWPDVKKLTKELGEGDQGFFQTLFSWDLFKIFLKAVFLAIVAAIINFGLLFLLFKSVFDFLCGSDWVQLILALGPIIVEIVGYVLSVIGVGVPIVGVGVFFEVFSMICDVLAGDWLSFGMGVAGLIPVGGLPFGIGKTIRKGGKLVSKLM